MFGKLSLKLWADLKGFNVLWLDRQGRRAYVERVPSQRFSPQWMDIPLWVRVTARDWEVYAKPEVSWMLDDSL